MSNQHDKIGFNLLPTNLGQYNSELATFLKEITITEIPAEYIDCIEVVHKNGDAVQLRGADITDPIPMNKSSSKGGQYIPELFRNVKTVRVYLDFDKLDVSLDATIDSYFAGIIKLET